MVAETKVRISGDAKGALTAIDKVKGGLTGLSKTAASLPGFTALGAAVAGAFSTSAISKIADTADALAKLSRRTTISIEDLSKYRYAADLSGVTSEQFATALDKLNKSIAEASEGVKKPADAFEALGVSVKNADGTMRGTKEVLDDVMGAFKAFPEGPEKAKLAMDVFGESGSRLASFLDLGKEGMAALREEAERLGIVFDEKLGAAAEQFNDNMTRLNKSAEALQVRIGNGLIPILTGVSNEFLAAQRAGLTFWEQLQLGTSTGFTDAASALKDLRDQLDALKNTEVGFLEKNLIGAGIADTRDEAIARVERYIKYFELLQETEQKASDQLTKNTTTQGDLEKKLAAEKIKYQKAVAEESKKTSEQQLKEAEKLRTEYVKAWEDAGKAAAKYREEGKQQAVQLQAESESQPSQGDAPSTVQGFSVTSKQGQEVQSLAANAIAAAYDKRFERVTELTAQANEKIKEAADYARTLEDPNERGRILQDIAKAAEQTGEAQAKAAEQQQENFAALANEQTQTIDALKAKLEELNEAAGKVQVQLKSDEALAEIKKIEDALKALQKEAAKIKVGELSEAPFQGSGATGSISGGATGSFAVGGFTGWGGKYSPAGIVHRGEYVFPQEAVRNLGVDRLRALHSAALRSLPGYSRGGLVSNLRMPAIKPANAGASKSNTLNLTIEGQKLSGEISKDFSEQVERFMRKARLKEGRR